MVRIAAGGCAYALGTVLVTLGWRFAGHSRVSMSSNIEWLSYPVLLFGNSFSFQTSRYAGVVDIH